MGLTDPVRPRPLGRPFTDVGTGYVTSVVFSRNGQILATVGRVEEDGMRLWDVTDPAKPSSRRLGRTEFAGAVAFSPDGSAVATVSDEGTRLWDVTDRAQAEPLGPPFAVTHVGGVSSVAFSPDGLTLAVGGADGTALWNTDVSQAVKRICRVTPKMLTR